jgi:gliding motility-associated-like protein/uncharacterized repeat protein (TIGR01451 family)
MQLYWKIIAACGLLLFTNAAFAQVWTTDPVTGSPVVTINDGTSVTLHANTTNAAAYQWYKNGVKINGAYNKNYTVNSAGAYSVVAYNQESCPSSVSDKVSVLINAKKFVDLMITIKPQVSHAIIGDPFSYLISVRNNSLTTGTAISITYTLPPNLVYIPSANNGNVTYDNSTRVLTWQVNQLQGLGSVSFNVGVKIVQAGTSRSVVNVAGKETDPILSNNEAIDSQQIGGLNIPNVFTPNEDGRNDTFIIPGLNNYTENDLSIINRWGNEVYHKKNYNNEWKGEGLYDGTYFYLFRAKNASGQWENYKGYITLLRTRM